MRDRLSVLPDKILIEHVFARYLAIDTERQYGFMMQVNEAHLVVLAKAGLVDADGASALAAVFGEMKSNGPASLNLDPTLEDLYFNIEREVTARAGTNIGGRMHTGRSRNDLGATVTKMRTRETVLSVVEAANGLREVLVARADEFAETIMTGYTHRQPAQPITFGFYLAGVADALERDVQRLMDCHRRMDECPLGAGALAGSGFALDTELAARLLAFSRPCRSALSAVATRDYVPELLFAMCSLTTTISRLAGDLYVWATREFGLIEIDDSVSIVSSIMPQKKNPITLEHCKTKAAHVLGSLVASLAAMRSAPFTNVRDVNREAVEPLEGAVEHTRAACDLMRITIETLRVRSDLMLRRATEDFSTATELADTLVTHAGLPFRVAHRLVARLVVEAIDADEPVSAITVQRIQAVAAELGFATLSMDQAVVDGALDPARVVASRSTPGSTSPREVRKLVADLSGNVRETIQWVGDQRMRISEAAGLLGREIESLKTASAQGRAASPTPPHVNEPL